MRLSAPILLLALGCAPLEERVALDLGGLPAFDLAFPAMLDGQGRVTRTAPPFGVAGGKLSFGALPSFVPAAGERSFVLATMSAAAIQAVEPRFDPARVAEIALAGAPAAMCAPGVVSVDGRTETLPFPPSASVYRAEVGGGGLARSDLAAYPFLAAGGLSVPVELEPCKTAGHDTLRAIGATPELLPNSATLGGRPLTPLYETDLIEVAVLDAGRVLAAASNALFLFEAGGARPDDGAHGRRFVAQVRGLALAPAPPGARERRATLVTDAGEVIDVLIGPAGIASVTTATIGAQPLWDGAWDGPLFIAVGDGGLVLTRTGTAARFTSASLGAIRQLGKVIATGDPASPQMVASLSSEVFEGDASRGRWKRNELANATTGSLHFHALGVVRGPAGLERWVGSANGVLFRRVENEDHWSQVFIESTPRYAGCASGSDACGHRTPNVGDRVNGLVTVPGKGSPFLSVVYENCNTPLLIRVSDHCSTPLVPPDVAVARSAVSLSAIDYGAGRLVAGGVGGRLYELRFE